MDARHTTPTDPDPVVLLDALTPEGILARLADLAGQQDALRVLLRAVRARRRRQPPTGGRQEVPCAS
jgi:hypothetical protein